jgi:NTP pyrophosphatase (non-canonical NTP hydrolase)
MSQSFVRAWNHLSVQSHKTAVDKGFYPSKKSGKDVNDGEKIALVHAELSEALEGLRTGAMDDKIRHRPAVEVELADAVIRIMDYAKHRKLDVAGAVLEKMAYNKTRPHKHGGKKF